MNVELMTQGHIGDVEEIERLCFSSPWSEESLGMLLREGGVGFVAVEDGRTVAYAGMLTVLDEGQITNIATHPDYRRRGFARAVTRALTEYAKEQELGSIYLEVRISNRTAIDLYESCGFYRIGTRKNFYSHPTEDAQLMKYDVREEE